MKKLLLLLSLFSSVTFAQTINCYNQVIVKENNILKPRKKFNTCITIYKDKIVQNVENKTLIYTKIGNYNVYYNEYNERYEEYNVIDKDGTYCRIIVFDDALLIVYEFLTVQYSWVV